MKKYFEEHIHDENLLMEKLVTDYKWAIMKIIQPYRFYSNDDVEDIFEDVVLHICEKIKRNLFRKKEVGTFKSWVYCLTTNYLISKYCRGRRDFRLLEEGSLEVLQFCVNEGQSLSAQERECKFATLEALVRSLPESHATLLDLKLNKNLTFREIAEIRKLPLSTVASQLQTVYKNLRKQMMSRGYIDSFV